MIRSMLPNRLCIGFVTNQEKCTTLENGKQGELPIYNYMILDYDRSNTQIVLFLGRVPDREMAEGG